MRMTSAQLTKLEGLLSKSQPGLVFPFPQICEIVGMPMNDYEPEDIRLDLRRVRRRLQKAGRDIMMSNETVWRSE